MINKILSDIFEKFSILKALDGYVVEFGVLTEHGFKTLDVNVLNTDDTITKTKMEINEIFYLTEHGTMTIPARPILEKIQMWVLDRIQYVINDIFEGITNKDWSDKDIANRLKKFEIEINIQIKVIFETSLKSNSTIANLLDATDENKYLIDFNVLKNYVSCRIYKK